MNIQFNKLATNAIDQTMMVAETVVGLGRAAAQGTAQVMHKARTPVRKVASTSIRINDITHRGVEKLVKVQAKAIERTVEAGAARFELAAKATSVRALVRTQIDLLPSSRARLQGNLRDTWTVVSETGSEFGALFSWTKPATKSKARGKAKTTRKPRATKAAKKTATAVKKTATRKKARVTKAVRKSSARLRKAA